MDQDDGLSLAADFAPADHADWMKLATARLKGRGFERIIARTSDGLPIAPLHARAADARPAFARPQGAGWQVTQRVDHPDAAAANAEALHDLENGANGLSLVF